MANSPQMDDAQSSFHPACPFLKLKNDPDVRFGFPHPGNYCYRSKPVEPVSVDYQEWNCLRSSYVKCVVFQDPQWKGRLPEGIRGIVRTRSKKRPVNLPAIIVIIICFLLVGTVWFFFPHREQDREVAHPSSNGIRLNTATPDLTTPHASPSGTVANRAPVSGSPAVPSTPVTVTKPSALAPSGTAAPSSSPSKPTADVATAIRK